MTIKDLKNKISTEIKNYSNLIKDDNDGNSKTANTEIYQNKIKELEKLKNYLIQLEKNTKEIVDDNVFRYYEFQINDIVNEKLL